MEKVIDRRQMQGDDGRTYAVLEIQEYQQHTSLQGKQWVKGMRRLELENGAEIINLDNRLTIRGTGVHLIEDE